MGRGLFDEQFLRIALRRGHWRQEEAEARITAARGLLARCAGREYRRDDWPGLCRRLYLPLLRLLGFQASRVGGRGGERFLQYRLSGPIGQSRIRAILTLPGQDPALADIEAAAILCRGEADWLIVTNGLSWRLQRRAGWGGLEAYQIELPCGAGQNVGDQEGEAFARWWRLLRAEAFAPQPGSRESWLDELAADYRGHMERLTAGLADRAVFAALPLLTEGVAVEAARRCRWCWPPEQERLELAYRAGIILLYRILFVLHAEARRVWPCNQRAYPSESLAELAVRAARRIEGCPDQFGEQADPGGDGRRRLQGSLRQRLRLLAGGCAGDNLLLACGERGGQDHRSGACRLLERCRIGDYYLAAALRLLVWDRPGGANPTSIDYATIDPGHLGQIYERIVSLQPGVAEDDLVRLGSRGGPRYVRLRAGVRRRTGRAVRLIRKGHIYLRPAPGRRKATGRYYTPASVIATLLQRALEPVIEQRLRCMRGRRRRTGRASARSSPRLLEDLVDLTVLDPAMGGGHFLLQAVDFIAMSLIGRLCRAERRQLGDELLGLGRRLVRSGGRWACSNAEWSGDLSPLDVLQRIIARRCLFGTDNDRFAVAVARLSLALQVALPAAPLAAVENNLRCGDAIVGRLRLDGRLTTTGRPDGGLARLIEASRRLSARAELRPGDVDAARQLRARIERVLAGLKGRLDAEIDARTGGGLERAGPLHWPVEFPELFLPRCGQRRKSDARSSSSSERNGFDAVVGNPPWISFSGRQAEPLPAPLARYYADTYAGFAGWRSMHGLFLERAICLVRRGGRVGLLLPIQVCDLRGYGPLRLAVTARATVDQPPGLIGEQSFAGVTGPAGLYSFTVGPTGRAAGSNGSAARWAWAPLGRRVEVISAAGVLGRIRQKLAAWPQVPPSAFGDPGVHTGNSAAVLIASTPGAQRAAIRQGSDVGRYHVARPSRWLRLHLRPCDGRYWRIGPLETYRRARLLLRQTADRPIAAWHEPPGYFRNSVLAFFGLAELDEAYVLAVLNSQLIGWMHRCSFRDACQRAFPQVKVEHLRALRLPQEPMGRTSARQRAWIERLWRQCQEPRLTTAADRSGGPRDDCDALVELARAPTVVIQHLLARLGRAMTRLAAAWHAERGRFLARLAEEVRDGPRLQPTSRRSLDRPCREHGERTDSLAALPGCNRLLGSTACWLAEQPPLEAILRALTRNGCGVRPARLEQQYGRWLEAQRPIRRRLICTDRLIDQMVYRLFGLERGEIAAVQDVLRQYAAAQGDCS